MKEYLNGYARAHPTEVFDPEALRILTAAFDNAWGHLQASGARLESERAQERARDIIAKYIIEQARHGERDEQRLRDGALLQYTLSNLRNPPHK